MEFEVRTLFECPIRGVISIPDVCGLFIVDEIKGDRIIVRPLRGKFHGFLFRDANPSILSLALSLDCTVRLLWFDDMQDIEISNLFGLDPFENYH